MDLINNKTGEIESISPEEAGNKFLSGEYAFKKGAPIPLVDQDGKVNEYLADDVYDAVTRGGFSFPSSEQIQNYHNEKKYGDRPFSAAALGAADFPTLGGASWALGSTGLVSKEALKEIPERNPIAHGVGAMASIPVSLLAGPESALVKMAGEAYELAVASGNATRIAEASAALTKARNALTAADLINPVKGITKLGSSAADLIAAAPREASLVEKAMTGLGRGALQGATEGAFYTAGELNREAAIGNPEINASLIAEQLGMGTLLGGAIGGLIHGGIETAGGVKSKLFPKGILSHAVDDVAREEGVSAAKLGSSVKSIKDELDAFAKPGSLEEISQKAAGISIPEGEAAESVTKKRMLEIIAEETDLPVPHELQIQSLDDAATRKRYAAFLQDAMNDKNAQDALKLEAWQKQQAIKALDNTISDLAPNYKPITDEVKAGDRAVKLFDTQYTTEKKELAPLFKRFDPAAVNKVTYPGELVGRLEEAIPGVSNYLDFDGVNGPVKLAKYDPGMPFSKNVYGAIKDLISSVNKEGLTLGELRNLRNTIADRVNLLSAPRDSAQIQRLKSGLMDFLASEIEKIDPSLKVRDLFKRYAINEQKREIIEKIFGGKIGDKFKFAKEIRPEKVLDRIFSDTVAVENAKDILGPKAFNELLADYLSTAKKDVTDATKNGFSSNKFASFLDRKEYALLEATKENPRVYRRLKNVTDYMRILPDAPPANPSNTAPTAKFLLSDVVKKIMNPAESISEVVSALKQKGAAEENKAILNEVLKGSSLEASEQKVREKVTYYNAVQRVNDVVEKAQKKLTNIVSRAVSPTTEVLKGSPGFISSRLVTGDRKERLESFDKISKKLNFLNNNPELMMNTINGATETAYKYVPNTSAALQSQLIRGLTFLGTKIPQKKTDSFYPEKFIPSDTEMTKFFKYYEAVEKPFSVLEGLSRNNVSVEGVETLRAVYPQLYDAMRAEVVGQLGMHTEKPTYQKMLALSMFLGQDMDSSLSPQMVMASQMSFGMSRQGNGANTDAVKPTQGGLSAINLAGRSMTPQDKTISRNEEK